MNRTSPTSLPQAEAPSVAAPNDAGRAAEELTPHYRLHHDPRSSHQQISELVRTIARAPILDVGAAQGMLGHLIHDTGLQIDAVEPNPQWAQAAVPFYHRVYQGTIEQCELPANHYQVIVCADVLEHTLDPAGVLERLKSHATRDAVFIISLPNVAYVAVRLMLLFGYFPKMERGVLDRTHLHFFTRRTATDMLRSAGLVVERAMGTVPPLKEIWPGGQGRLLFKVLTRAQHGALRLLPAPFAYQWVYVARRS